MNRVFRPRQRALFIIAALDGSIPYIDLPRGSRPRNREAMEECAYAAHKGNSVSSITVYWHTAAGDGRYTL